MRQCNYCERALPKGHSKACSGLSCQKALRAELARLRRAKNPEQARAKAREYESRPERKQAVASYRKAYQSDYRKREYALAQKREAEHLFRVGITHERRAEVLALQQGLCVICGRKLRKHSNSSLLGYADHCHTSGKFRGLLCFGCNTFLGVLADSAEACRAVGRAVAAGYLSTAKLRGSSALRLDPDYYEACALYLEGSR